MGGSRGRRWLGAAWYEDSAYRRVVQALLVANVVAAIALVVILVRGDDPEAAEQLAGTGSGNAFATPEPAGTEPAGTDPAATDPAGTAPAETEPAETEPADPATTDAEQPAAEAPAVEPPATEPAFLTPPEEFRAVPDEVAGTGPLGLDDVVRLDGADPDVARERFAELGFVDARSRAWQSPDDSLLVVAYRFRDREGASTYVEEATDLRRRDPAVTGLGLPSVPGGDAFQLQVPGDPTQVAFLSRGEVAYVVGLVGPAADDPSSRLLERLAGQQYDAAA